MSPEQWQLELFKKLDQLQAGQDAMRTELHTLATRVTVLETRDSEIEKPNRVIVREMQRDIQTMKTWIKGISFVAATGLTVFIKWIVSLFSIKGGP